MSAATVGSTKGLRAEGKPFQTVASAFTNSMGAHGSAYSVAWIEQVRPATAVVESFEERRTVLEKEARDAFETKDCYFHGSPDLLDAIVKFGFSAALQADAGTFCLNAASALSAAKVSADVAQNKDTHNRIIACRVSLGIAGKHHRVVGSATDQRFILTDVRGVVPSFLIGFRYNAHTSARSQPSGEPAVAEAPAAPAAAVSEKPAAAAAAADDDDDAEVAAELARLKKKVTVSHT
jgi:hypothetical protein